MQPFFEWLESLQISATLDPSGYLVAAVNVVHLLGLTLFIGALVIVDIRLLGRGIVKQPLAQVAREAQPWLIGAFLVLITTGAMQVLATPFKAYYSPHFWFKMQLVAVGVIFTFTLRRKVTFTDETRLGRVIPKLVALVSMGLWTSVAVAGRLIGMM